jgi:hypothetical protein
VPHATLVPGLRRELAVVALACASLAAAPAAAARAPFSFYDRGPYHEAVPRPEAVLGYAPGTFHTTWGNMERVLDAIERARPERVRREPFGRTVESRERSLFIVSSPENLARLEAIRAANAKLADPRGVPAGELERLARETPVTVWLNYSIHGDESASFEAMMQVAYQLVAGDDSLTRELLADAVVVMNPAHNPDGHERFVTWINAHGQGNPEHWALEQQRSQPWGIGGRRTHYQFDPNRDALAMSQPESRQMSRAIRRWRPQVFVDHHGQTASFFFPPTAEPTNHTLPLATYRKWVDRFGRGNAAAFDRHGWNYYVRDIFDFHATGYWDVWPTLQGAIGMTYETDGGGNLAFRRDDETVVTLLDGMARHFTASLATLETAVRHREARLADQLAFARESLSPAARGPRAYLLDPAGDPVRAAAMVENLQYAGVEVQWVARAFTARSARLLWGDPGSRPAPAGGKGLERAGSGAAPVAAAAARPFANGAFVVDLAQPGSRIARALIEEDRSVDSSFARVELEKYARNVRRGRSAPAEPYNFYDITAWALPLAYGVPAYAVNDVPGGGVRLAEPDPNALDEAADPLPDSLAVGVPFTARVSRVGPLVFRDASGKVVFDARGSVEGGEATTAYVWSCATDGAGRLALRLLQEGFKVAASARPLRAGGRDFPRGSFIARVERNPAALHARVAKLARTSGVQVHAVNTAYIDRGDTGVGSEYIVSLKKPSIAVVVDGSVSAEAYGWLWFLLERRLGVRFTAVRANRLGGIDLDRYNIVVLPDGGPGLAGSLGVGTLKDWVSRGGTLVCLDDAAELPTLASVGLSTSRVVGVPAKPRKEDEEIPHPDSSAAEATRRPQYIPGTVFWATPDPRQWLSWGYGEGRIPVMLQGSTLLTPTREGANALRFDRVPLTVTGWTWPETERRLAHTVFAMDEPHGGGHVVMIGGPVVFRSFWRNTERLLTNALLYAPALD